MRILFSISVVFALGLSGCKTYDTVEYFGKTHSANGDSLYGFAETLNLFGDKPLTQEAMQNGDSIYRFRVSPSGNPAHLIKVETKADGTGKVSVQQSNVGYGYSKRKTVIKSDVVNPSKAEVAAFLSELEEAEFWAQEEATQYSFEDIISTGPTFFSIAGQSLGKDVVYTDFDYDQRKNTARIALAFYAIAGVSEEEDWTYIPFLTGFAEVDWDSIDE